MTGALKVQTAPGVWTTIGGNSATVSTDPLDVRSYGPIGSDGVVNAATINAAIAATDARSGRLISGAILKLPSGDIPISNTLNFWQTQCGLRGVGPDTVLLWTGAAGLPMIDVRDSSRNYFGDMTILGNATNPPSVGIYNEAPTVPMTGSNEFCSIERIMFGRHWMPTDLGAYPMQYGVKFGSVTAGNNDQFLIKDCQFNDCSVVGLQLDNGQSRWGTIENCCFNQCGKGVEFYCSVTCYNMQFNRCDIDIRVMAGETLVYSYWSEQSKQLWYQDSLSTLRIFGGSAQLHPPMVGHTYYAESFVGGNTGSGNAGYDLTLVGVRIDDQMATGAILHIYSSSSEFTPAGVFIRSCNLPRGNSDAGYDIDGNNNLSRLHIDIQQGIYWRRQIARSVNMVGSFELPRTRDSMDPTGCIAATVPKWGVTASLTAVSGTLYLFGVELLDGDVITALSFVSLAAAVAPTNQWFGLFNSSLAAIALTNDDTTTAWAAQAFKTLNLSAPYTVTQKGMYYIGCMQAAGTPATLQSTAASTVTNVFARAPSAAHITASTGLTAPPALPFTATLGTTNNRMVYAYAT